MSTATNQDAEQTTGLEVSEVWKCAYRRYYHFWLNLARAVQITEDEAKDVVHTVVLACIRPPAREFDSLEHLRNYVAKGVVNRAIHQKKRNDRHHSWDEGLEETLASEAALPSEATDAVRHLIRQGLSRLPRRDVEILKHRFYSGLKFAQISELTGMPISTLKSREDSAIRRLRKWFRKNGYGTVL